MPTCIPKKTRLTPGTKGDPSEKVFDVKYFQGLLRSVEEGIKEEKLRVRELSASNVKLQNRWTKLRHDGDELYDTMVELRRELRKEKERTARLRYHANISSASRSMGQNCGSFQPAQGYNPSPYQAHTENGAYWAPPNSQDSPHHMDPRVFFNPTPHQYQILHVNMFHLQHQQSPPLPQPRPRPNYFHNQHIPQPADPANMGLPGLHHYPGLNGVPQYGY